MKYFLFLLLSLQFALSFTWSLALPFALLHAQEESPYYFPRRPVEPEGTSPAEPSQAEREGIIPEGFFDSETEKEKRFKQIVDSRLNIHFGYSYTEMHDLVMASSELDSESFPLESQIDWKLQDILVLSASLESRIRRIYFRVGARVPLILTDTPMSKRDWLFDNQVAAASPPGTPGMPATPDPSPLPSPPYDFPDGAASHYSSAETRNEFSFSLEAALLFNLLKESDGAPHIELGGSFLYMTWGAIAEERKGLYLLDNTGAAGFNAPEPNEGDSINYRIHYLVPGFSMRFDVQWGIYGFEASLNYSPATFFLSHHEYYADNLRSDGFGVLGQMLWGSITNRFWLNEYVAFSLGLRGKVLFRSRIGGLEQTNTDTGETTNSENTAGSEYFDLEVFMGVTMGF